MQTANQKITSFSNEKIKLIQKLKDKSSREEFGQFIIEGYREIKKSLLHPTIEFLGLYISPECFLGENENFLIREFLKRRVKVFEIKKAIFEKISYRDRPDGLLAVAKLLDFRFKPNQIPKGDLYLIIEGVEKPGNLGTILRTAEGGGVSSIFVTDPKIDLHNPNVIRSSTGTIFTLPIFLITLDEIKQFLNFNQIPIYGLSPEAKTFYFQRSFKKPVAFLFGSEQYGISSQGKILCNELLSIPMKGSADSLNLAMSVGIVVYDVLRQRIVNNSN